jgi:hypothetical protein
MRDAYKVLVRKPEGKRPCRRSRCRWEYNIKIGLRETGWEGVEWIYLAQDGEWWWPLVNMVMNIWVP